MRDEALQRIRALKLRRLEDIEIQVAAAGEFDADPKLLIERDELKKALGLMTAVADGLVDDDTRKLFRRYDQADLNIAVLSNVVQRVSAIEEWITFDRAMRGRRQHILDAWLLLISVGVLLLIGARYL